MDDDWLVVEFAKRAFGNSLTQKKYFTDVTFNEFAQKFSIPVEIHNDAQVLLEMGAHQWETETDKARKSFKSVRAELRQIRKTVEQLADFLDAVTEDTWQTLSEAGVWRSMVEMPLPRVVQHDAGTEASPSRVLHFSCESGGETQKVSLSFLRKTLSALEECARSASPAAGGGRQGRPEDDAMFFLLHTVFQVWESLLNREFKLNWHTDSEPLTDAAEFCVSVSDIVAKVSGAKISRQRIITVARKIQETSIKINNLEEVDQVIDHYRKQYE